MAGTGLRKQVLLLDRLGVDVGARDRYSEQQDFSLRGTPRETGFFRNQNWKEPNFHGVEPLVHPRTLSHAFHPELTSQSPDSWQDHPLRELVVGSTGPKARCLFGVSSS